MPNYKKRLQFDFCLNWASVVPEVPCAVGRPPASAGTRGFQIWSKSRACEFIGFGAMDVTKPYEFIGFGAMAVTKPYEFIGFGATAWSGPKCKMCLCVRSALHNGCDSDDLGERPGQYDSRGQGTCACKIRVQT